MYLPSKKVLIDGSYTVHTHYDLPNFLRNFSSNSLDLLTLVLAAAHDSFEEGSIVLLTSDGGKTHSMVKPDHFFTHLENKTLGLQLQVGIQALTEPTMQEVKQNMNRTKFNQVVSSKGNALLRNAKKTFYLDVPRKGGHQVDEDFAYDFLQYGCLGMQYELIVKILNEYALLPEGSYKLTPIELRSLASSIIRVEIADRMSEMADLYYLFERRKDIFTPEYLKMEYLLTGGRMVNAYYHLIKARDALSPDSPDYESIQLMLKHYLPFLAYQVNAINTVMQKSGRGISLTYDEVMHYAKHDYHNQQEWVNSLITPFMQERVKNILSCLS